MGSKLDLMSSPFIDPKEMNEGILVERKQMTARMNQIGSVHYECSALTKDGLKESLDSIIITVAAS